MNETSSSAIRAKLELIKGAKKNEKLRQEIQDDKKKLAQLRKGSMWKQNE